MITVLQDPDEIEAVQTKLHDRLVSNAVRSASATLGYQGGKQEETVHYLPELDMWYAYHRAENRYWNSFGLGNPFSENGTLSIIVEINPPLSGIDRRIAGAAGRNDDGDPLLLHRGKVGGGREGIGKTNFLNFYDGALKEVTDGERTSRAVVVSNLESPRALAHIRGFVGTVQRFKDLITTGSPSVKMIDGTLQDAFSPEFEGTKVQGAREKVTVECDHGAVVNTLQEELGDSYLVGNDQHRDLFLLGKEKELRVLFEVKSQPDKYSIYRALGQLIYHSPSQKQLTRVLVVPSSVPAQVREHITDLGFETVTYEWNGQRLNFHGLSKVL